MYIIDLVLVFLFLKLVYLNLNNNKLGMTAFITEITVKSMKKITDTYFKLTANESFVSKISHSDVIRQTLLVPISQTQRITFEIWGYEPHSLVKSWNIDASNFLESKNKYKIVQKQWTIIFVLSQKTRGFSENKQNIRHKNLNSISSFKELRFVPLTKKENKSRVKDINLVLQEKKKNKAGVKKALKSTIDYLIMQNNHEDYGLMEPQYPKTGKCTPSYEQVSYLKSQSSLYSDYGFNSSEFSKRFEEKQSKSNEAQQDLVSKNKKQKIKFR